MHWDARWITHVLSVLGGDEASRITDSEEHHGAPELAAGIHVKGVVRSIEAVSCEFAQRSPHDRTRYPVPGTAILNSLSYASGWENEQFDPALIGYVVDVEGD
jgi:hypothetical protein